MFKLASLIVELVAETSSLDRALSRTHANLTTANVALGTFAGNVAASFARMTVGAAGGLFEATVRSASHLGETMNRVKVVLGDSADKVIKDADVMADRYGFVKNEVLGAASSFSLLGREMKLSEAGSADLGVKLTRMASELTSFFDPSGGLPAMMHKLESGLAGQARPLRELGIFMTAAAVKTEAARIGLKPGASGELSEGDKIKARISFIENSKAMKLASGDLERTLGDTENQTRKFWGTLSNLATSVGQELNPAWNKLLQSFNSGLDDLKGYFEANKSMVRNWGDSVVEGFNTAKIVWRNLPDVMEIALLGADQKMEDARAKIEQWATSAAVSVESAFLKAGQSVGNFFKKSQDMVTAGASYGASGLEKAAGYAQSAAESVSKTWDSAIGAIGFKADVAFRPIRDLANFIEKKAGAGGYKQMSVEEDIGRLKGGLSGIPKALGALGDYFKTYQDVAGESIKGKPTDFTSGLIDKANKHLADTMAENTDVSSKAIAVATARIGRRETARLAEETANRNVQYLTDEYAKMFPGATKAGTGKGKAGGGGAAETVTAKHEKMLTDTASFAMNLQASQLGGNVQEKQLTELQQIRAIDQKNADMMEKMLARQGMAVFG